MVVEHENGGSVKCLFMRLISFLVSNAKTEDLKIVA